MTAEHTSHHTQPPRGPIANLSANQTDCRTEVRSVSKYTPFTPTGSGARDRIAGMSRGVSMRRGSRLRPNGIARLVRVVDVDFSSAGVREILSTLTYRWIPLGYQ